MKMNCEKKKERIFPPTVKPVPYSEDAKPLSVEIGLKGLITLERYNLHGLDLHRTADRDPCTSC